jgi:hypothetical protein
VEYPWATSLRIDCPVVDTKPGFDPVEYGTLVCAKIECLLPPKGHPKFIGEIQLEKILVQDARRFRVALKDVFAERGFDEIFPVLFTDRANTKPELEVVPGWVDIQVITRMRIAPRYRTESVVVRSIQTLIGFLGANDLVVVPSGFNHGYGVYLTAKELRTLEFKRIANTPFALRANPASEMRRPMNTCRFGSGNN